MVCLALRQRGLSAPKRSTTGATAWEALAARAARSRDPRHRPAAARRPRALPPAARAVGDAADHLRDLARGGVRPRARPRDRRRRLPVQAVLDARADGARQGAAAPRQRLDAAARDRRSSRIVGRRAGARPAAAHRRLEGTPVPLTVTEFLLLQALVAPPGHRQDPRAADGGRVSRPRLGQRSDDRQPRQADPPQVRRRSIRRSTRSKACTAPATAIA